MIMPPSEVVWIMPDGRTSALPMALRPFRKLLGALRVGQLTLNAPDGGVLNIRGSAPGPKAALRVRRWRVFRRAALRGDVGLGEAFMDGDWDSPDLAQTLTYFAVNTAESGHVFSPRGLGGFLLKIMHRLRENSLTNARRNIAAHYDLGDAFYAAWLDSSMTYSAGLFGEDAQDLETAQRDKYRALIARAGISQGDHVLEIGCGWGGFACLAAQQTGCRVTAITLSPSQCAYAKARVAASGLERQVTVIEQDYRDVVGTFDRIVSIEMIEAVGERYWPIYFSKVADLLRPGGVFGLQAITIRDKDFPNYRRTSDFLQTYIFPGGMLPPEAGVLDLAAKAGLKPGPSLAFGQDYARTLAAWREKFEDAWPTISELGFDERFKRMWLFYLASCEAGFRSGLITVSQTVFTRI